MAKPAIFAEGVPAAILEQTGESYIDAKTGNQYLKNTSGAWELILSFALKADKSVVDTLSNTVAGKVNLTALNILVVMF